MAKQPMSVLADNPRQNRLFLIILAGLIIISMLFLGFNQLTSAHAQTANGPLNFGNVTVGTNSGTQDAVFSVSPSLTTTYNVTATYVGDGNFTVVNNGCNGVNVSPDNSCSVTVQFNPLTAGPHAGTINFAYGPAAGFSPGSGEAVINSEGGSKIKLTNSLNAPSQQVPTASTALSGVGIPATTTAPSPSPSIPVTTKPQPTCGSQIQGYVLIDGKPGAGVVVNLTGTSKNSVTIGDGGYFYFNNLCAGDYTVSLDYDHTKYKANDADVRQFKLDGKNPSRDNAFSLSTIPATTAVPTTAAPTTAAPTTAAPTTPATTAAPTTAAPPTCNLTSPVGTVLRLCTATSQLDGTHFLLTVQVGAGDSPVNLNDTVIVNLPSGATVTAATASLGTATVTSNNTVRWGTFSLSPKQSASLVLSIDAPNGNLNGSSLFVSGSFNRSQAFQQRIPGLPGLIDIVPASVTQATGGQGGGVPSQAPATGTGQDGTQDTPVFWLILAAIAAGGLGIFGLYLTGRSRKPDQKEQK